MANQETKFIVAIRQQSDGRRCDRLRIDTSRARTEETTINVSQKLGPSTVNHSKVVQDGVDKNVDHA
jgi:hypothetical protein